MNWHAQDAATVERRLETSERGLSQATVQARQLEHGPNELEETLPPNRAQILIHQFRSPLIAILLLAAGGTLALGEWIDAGVIAAVLILNAVIGFTQEWKAEVSARSLMQLLSPHARVIRDGREWDVESRELVPGDLVLLESGVRVPADLRLIAATHLGIDESPLTGESLPVLKGVEPVDSELPAADRTNMAHAGTVVTTGRGRGYVVATGRRTELGKIAEHVRTEVEPETPLQRRMGQFARLIGVVVAVASAAAFGIGVSLGESPAEMFMVAVSLAVAAVPEGLPVVFTITLAVGVQRMARRNAVIRRLSAVETLGSTTTIGSDKTGTLTENRMTVQEIWSTDEPATLLAGVLTNEARLHSGEGAGHQGDPTEVALLLAAAERGIDPEEARDRHSLIAEIPFEPVQQFSASVRERDGEQWIYVKGAPERVLAMCARGSASGSPLLSPGTDGFSPGSSRSATGPGSETTSQELGAAPQALEAARAMATRGLRVLAMAWRRLERPLKPGEPVPEPSDLTFLGLQGMMDPPRPGVREAIRGCQDAGIRVVMITGDHAATARAIGEQLGIGDREPATLIGAELEPMDDEELARQVGDVSIYARVTPEHKLRVVRALRRRGEVVAVTGDGVNDAPALKAADIGVAMGRDGTDVAREASDMILTDDNFVSIYAAVEEGRVTFDNLRKATFFLISTGAAAVLMILASQGLRWPLPLLPAQLLWLNLVTNGLQDVALAFEPGEPGVPTRPPRDPREGILSPHLWERTVVTGVVMAVATLLLFRWELNQTGSLARAQTVALTTMVLFQNFHVGNARSETRSIFGVSPFSNPFLLAAVAAASLIHVGALYLPLTQLVLRVEPIEWQAWLRMFLTALSIVVVIELHKVVRQPRYAARHPAPRSGLRAPR
jgi:cation-transporting ATPase F